MIEEIAQEGAAMVAQQSVAPAASSWLSGAWKRLVEPSPRSMPELSADAFAMLINGGLDKRSSGAASEAKVGEGVMDCVYALMSGQQATGSSPIGRLFSAVVGFFARLRSRGTNGPQSTSQPSALGELRVG